MLSSQRYITLSLELHLFFARIMKEHSIFLEAGFTPKNTKLSKEADEYKIKFEKLLLDTVKVSEGVNIESVINSGEIYSNIPPLLKSTIILLSSIINLLIIM